MPEAAQSNAVDRATMKANPPIDLSSLDGKGVLVAGGATGVGAALVRALADAGAYVTIADDNAVEGQRLMLDLVSDNKRAQYTYTRAPSFPSQAESFQHASSFRNLALVIASAIPAPSSPSASTPPDSLLSWLASTPPPASAAASSSPVSPPAPPSTAPVDTSVTAALYTAHLACHYFRGGTAEKAGEPRAVQAAGEGGGKGAEGARVNGQAADGVDGERKAGGSGATGHLLFLAPRAYVVGGGVAPDALAAGAAAAGFRSVVRGLAAVARSGELGVRVNMVAVGEEELEGGGKAAEAVVDGGLKGEKDGLREKEGAEKGKEQERKKYATCVEAAMRLVCDESASGHAIMVSQGQVRQGRI
ncbi:hypothetical protein B0J12DRAFT_737447 [Macrophomina phaseolina]|uniref:Short-chain dehydrogenase/reductase SDR n=1 Tax=Macrophomina phaseolina TaxID=35725 RepID=A0ABQ8GL20_9PEZI|nr:hypothetical protein B0J12DRAFT_737447 [Macrophomina phaseolina]